MKKRLRKKKHLGEFIEWGVSIVIARKKRDDFERFFDDFIEEAIEGNACSFGGGGKDDRLEGMIQLGKACDGPDERLKKITGWLEAREDVQNYVIGKLVDLWHGPLEDRDGVPASRDL